MEREHPYYILDVPWSDARQRAAATEFLKFLVLQNLLTSFKRIED